jgi:O-antigen/teichoic acid export membrane protein
MFSALVVTTIYFIRIRGMVGTWSSAMWKSTSPYWKLTLGVSFIGVTIGSIDKFFLSHYLGAAELGLYSAYLLSSTLIVGHIVSALANVFSPTINSIGNQGVALKKIDRLMMVGFIPIILSVYIISLIIIKLFGAQYQLNYWFVAIVALTAFLQIVAGFYGSLISSSENLYRMSTKIYFFKPVAIGLLVLILMLNPDIISLYTIFLFGIILYLYDIISTRLCFALVRAY